jgi:hypothetical protein
MGGEYWHLDAGMGCYFMAAFPLNLGMQGEPLRAADCSLGVLLTVMRRVELLHQVRATPKHAEWCNTESYEVAVKRQVFPMGGGTFEFEGTAPGKGSPR